MGGLGSGNWHRWRLRPTVESLPEIDVRDLKGRGGHLIVRPRDELAGGGRTYHYLRSGSSIWMYEDIAALEHALGFVLALEATPCHFGGFRLWLRCPKQNCGRRVRSLFIGENGIACRKCHQLCYESQYGGEIERRLTRLRNYRRAKARGAPIHKKRIHEEQIALLTAVRKIERGVS
jgi:hypothetical protein